MRGRAIVAEKVSYIYPDGTIGITDVSLEVLEGERVVLLGPNGSGKSTLIMLLSGLLHPSKGRVEILGVRPSRKNSEFLRRNIAVVFQNPDDFLFNPTVREELLYTPAQLGIPYDKAMKIVEEFSMKFGMDEILEKPPFRLSGGEKKKVSIVCSIMLNPKILFLDEPTANVDAKTRRKILEMAKRRSSTIVTATHELDIVPEIGEKVVLLGIEKRVKAVGGLEILENRKLLEEAGII
jgi:cobalt/nickel transport system ATP-binding protein